jgi:hypothetical protein
MRTVMRNGKRKQWEWSIKFDEHLKQLLSSEGIEDHDQQMLVCGCLCAIGLAKHRLFGETTDTFESHHHEYTSTKTMRKLAEKWL